jgi:hypothetical protein
LCFYFYRFKVVSQCVYLVCGLLQRLPYYKEVLMSVIISLLEKMGQNAALRYANAEQLAELMADTDPALIEAVIAGDQKGLEGILGARSNIVCAVYPADEPEQEEPAEDEKEDERIHFQHAG